jgi:hypothetical protein
MKKLRRIILMLGLVALASCYYDVEEELYPNNPCQTTNMSFTADIKPIIDQNCVGCHSGPAPNAQIDLSTYDGVKQVADNGKLLDVISRPNGDPSLMPPSGKLSDCKIRKINSWVIDGALPN